MRIFWIILIILNFITDSALASIWNDPLGSESKMPATRPAKCDIDSDAKTIDLISAINIALCNNPETQIAWFNAKSSAALLGSSRSEYLPNINILASEQKVKSINNVNPNISGGYNVFSPNISLNYLLFDFGGREARIEATKQQMLAAGYNYNTNMQNTLFAVVRNYANVLITEESLKSAQQAEKASKEILEAAKIKLEVGTATPADKAQSETAYSQSQLDTQNAENNLQIARGNFATLLHISPFKTISLKGINFDELSKPLSQNISDLINEAIEQRPDLAAAIANEKQAKAEWNKAKRANYPTISAIGSASKTIYGESNIRSRQDSSIGVQISVPFFTGFKNHYQTLAAENAYLASKAQKTQIEDNAALDVWTSYNNYQTSRVSYETAKSLLKSAQMSEELTVGRYKVGKGSLIDALNAQAQSASARFTQVQAKNNLLVTKFDLDRALGLITTPQSEELNIN